MRQIPPDIPIHYLDPDEYLSVERIEKADPEIFAGYHRHDFYEILWFTNLYAKDEHTIDFVSYSIRPHDIYILSPHQIHMMEVGDKTGFLIPISKDIFESVFSVESRLLSFPYFLKVSLGEKQADTLFRLMLLIEEEYHTDRRRMLLKAYLQAFMIHLQDSSDIYSGSRDKNKEKVIQILSLIRKNYKIEKEIGFYASSVNLSKRRVNEIITASTGRTVKQHISNHLIIEAKRYIGLGQFSFKEIAYELGFSDPSYFSRFFKSKTGLQPDQFARTIIFPSTKTT